MPGSMCSVDNIWVTGKSGSLGNNMGTESLGDFRGILVGTSVYPKFFHLYKALMGIVSKVLMYESIIEIVARAVYTWLNNVVQKIKVRMILLYDVYINVFKFVFVSGIDIESASLGVSEGARLEFLMGGSKESTIHL